VKSRNLKLAITACAWALAAGTAVAQDYPSKPIRMLTSAVGSGSDLVARLIADMLHTRLGQRGIVDNRGILAPELAARSAPDGYTLIFYSTPLWVSAFFRDNVPWDAVRDFAPISLGVDTPNVLVVHPSLPAKSVRELVALARAQPGKLDFGTGSSGSTSHLSAELFSAMAGITLNRVPYKGVGPAAIALLGGEIQMVFATGTTVGPHIRSGKLRPLGVTSLKPSALFPGMPTVADGGVPGFEAGTPMGIFTRAGTPPAIINRLHQTIVGILNSDDVKKRVMDTGAEVIGSSPDAFAAYLKADIAKWGKLVKERGLRQ